MHTINVCLCAFFPASTHAIIMGLWTFCFVQFIKHVKASIFNQNALTGSPFFSEVPICIPLFYYEKVMPVNLYSVYSNHIYHSCFGIKMDPLRPHFHCKDLVYISGPPKKMGCQLMHFDSKAARAGLSDSTCQCLLGLPSRLIAVVLQLP